ncbi:hemolysin [Bacteroidales bacterium]|nr:hemolysin [Bacteroidales bacterium]
MSEADKIELRSEEVQEILTRPPHALVRWGVSVISGLVLFLFMACFFFTYPDIMSGEIIITTENPPVWIVAKSTGKIKYLYCADKQSVVEGDLLAVLDNSAESTDVYLVQKALQECQILDTVLDIPLCLFTNNYALGEIQGTYSAFIRSAIDFENFILNNLLLQEQKSTKIQIVKHSIYFSNLKKSLELKEKEMLIAQSSFEREKELHQKGITSKSDMELAEQAYLNIQQSLQQIKISLASDDIQSSQLSESVTKLSIQYRQERKRLFSNLISAYQELIASIETWEQTYILRSPGDGLINFNNFWKQNQFVRSGDKVFVLVAHESGDYIGKMLMPSVGFGKVKEGQRVNIKVAGYPYMEYGNLKGSVKNVSFISKDKFYTLEVALPKKLLTTHGKELFFTGELEGQADIVTEDRSLAERILSPLRYLLEKHKVG